MKHLLASIVVVIFAFCAGFPGCKHAPVGPFSDDDLMPIDSSDTNPGDTVVVDPPDTLAGIPCEPGVVYFKQDILPILISNCAFSGCHDAESAEDGVILISYETVLQTADVEPFDLKHSEIYEVLTEDDEDKRMPPLPTPPLDPEKVQLIAQWILQGAEDLECDPDFDGCDTDEVSYADFVAPTIDTHCAGCHGGATPSGGIELTDHTGVKSAADNGSLYGAIAWESGFEPMPQGGDQLPDCTIDKIKSWIDAGAPNN